MVEESCSEVKKILRKEFLGRDGTRLHAKAPHRA